MFIGLQSKKVIILKSHFFVKKRRLLRIPSAETKWTNVQSLNSQTI